MIFPLPFAFYRIRNKPHRSSSLHPINTIIHEQTERQTDSQTERQIQPNPYSSIYHNQQLGLFEGSDAAWENADYHITLEALRKEFEIESRFNDISMKLDLVKDNAR